MTPLEIKGTRVPNHLTVLLNPVLIPPPMLVSSSRGYNLFVSQSIELETKFNYRFLIFLIAPPGATPLGQAFTQL